MRSSKSKAMDQVKQWCGSMKEEENDSKFKTFNSYCYLFIYLNFESHFFKIIKH